MLIVVMGVSGAGKSAVGGPLAERLRLPYLEGDDFHERAHRDQIRAGVPLTAEQRVLWLERLHHEVAARRNDGAVLTCSALTGAARHQLSRNLPVRWVHLRAPTEVLARRLDQRRGHFAGPGLLPSQLATLEPPKADEAVIIDVDRPLDEVVTAALAELTPPGLAERGR